MSTQMDSGLRQWFQMGAELANKKSLAQKIRAKFPESAHRTVGMVIVRPLPEIIRDVPDWLRLYAEGRFKDGAVEEETFSLYMDPTNNQILISDSWKVGSHTVIFYMEENTCWALASRTESVYSAYMKDLPIHVAGKYVIRDMELIDEILQNFYDLMSESGHDLAALLGGV